MSSYLPNDIRDFKIWKSNGSKYISFEDKIHDMLKVNGYTHIVLLLDILLILLIG